nr:transposase [Candidatus Dependentiae bacterium]
MKSKKAKGLPVSRFKPTSSVHYDKRTYRFKEGALSLYTLSGRSVLRRALGKPQKEAQLVSRNKKWFFNLVFDIPDVPLSTSSGDVLGVDLGENVVAATYLGKLYAGRQLRHKRDCAVAQRRRLQRKGTKSSKRKLKKT